MVGDKFCAAADIKDGNITKVFAEYCSKLLPVLCKGSMPPGSNKPGVDIERNMTSINVERNGNKEVGCRINEKAYITGISNNSTRVQIIAFCIQFKV